MPPGVRLSRRPFFAPPPAPYGPDRTEPPPGVCMTTSLDPRWSGRRPRARGDVVFRPLVREWVLYDPETRLLHVLNPTAALVWSLCDGAHDVDAIAGEMRDVIGEPPDMDTLRVDVVGALQSFEEKGLLEEVEVG